MKVGLFEIRLQRCGQGLSGPMELGRVLIEGPAEMSNRKTSRATSLLPWVFRPYLDLLGRPHDVPRSSPGSRTWLLPW